MIKFSKKETVADCNRSSRFHDYFP